MIITAGKYKGRKITAPNEKITRPTLSKVRMGVFNILYSIMGDFEGKSFLDLFGGSGIMGLEALSRGFSHAAVFELNKQSARIIRENYKKLGIEANLTIGDSLKLLEKNDMFFDVIYVDPPYESGIYESLLKIIKSGIVVLEHSEPVDTNGFKVLRSKDYGGKFITIIQKTI